MSQVHIPNIKQRVEPGQFNAMLTLGILDIAPKGIYSFLLEKRAALKKTWNFTKCQIFTIWIKPLVPNRFIVGWTCKVVYICKHKFKLRLGMWWIPSLMLKASDYQLWSSNIRIIWNLLTKFTYASTRYTYWIRNSGDEPAIYSLTSPHDDCDAKDGESVV